MQSSEAYGIAALGKRLPGEALSLESLAALPAYIGLEAQHDTIHDSCLITLDTSFGLPGQGLSFPVNISMEILGPYWDLVYRVELIGVRDMVLPRGGLLAVCNYIEELRIVPVHDAAKRLVVSFLGFPDELSMTFEKGSATRYRLVERVERVAPDKPVLD